VSSEPLRRLGALLAVDGDGRLRGVVTLDQVRRAVTAAVTPPGRVFP
jgi:CBS domain-containing protein